MYDYDDMKCHAYDYHANACVTPECYNLEVVNEPSMMKIKG
jgi:hypothetical protein